MKIIANLKTATLALSLLLGLSACEDAKYDALNGKVYMANAAGVSKSERLIIDDAGSTVSITMRASVKATEDIRAEVAVDEAFLANFNAKYGTSYELLPDEFHSLKKAAAVVINRNESTAEPLAIQLTPLSDDLNKTGKTYALPVSLQNVAGPGVSLLDASSHYLFVIAPIPMSDVPVFKAGNSCRLYFNQALTVDKWTVEFLMNISQLGVGVGQLNNQILFTTGGGQGIFLRFGDVSIPGTQLQLKALGTQVDMPNKQFSPNKWYHIAIVNEGGGGNIIAYADGVEIGRNTSPGTSTTIAKDVARFCGESGSDGYMKSELKGSQLRFWSVARSAEQVKNNMYDVDPASEGLEGYWRMNEGTGKDLKDATVKGNNAQAEEYAGALRWSISERTEVGR